MKKRYIKPKIRVQKNPFITLLSRSRFYDSLDGLMRMDNVLLAAPDVTEGTVFCCGYPCCV